MQISLTSEVAARVPCDLLVVVAEDADSSKTLRLLDRATAGGLLQTLRQRRFAAPSGSPVLYQPPPRALGAGAVLVVPGSTADVSTWRTAADLAVTRGREINARRVVLPVPDLNALEVAAETADLAAYTFNRLKTKMSSTTEVPASLLLMHQGTGDARAALARGRLFARATCLTRELVNLPADIVTPTYLAREAKRIAQSGGLRARVFDQTAIRKHGMGGLLGVARGSAQPPRFIELVYRPRRPAKKIALVGKGITFDSGGLSLKTADGMQSQKRDMAGGAAVLGIMSAVREVAPALEVRGYIPTTENMPSGSALKPGDVLKAYGGTTIEVLNTDAEGRLVLADALSFAARAKPDVLIDFATLTGAVRSALGSRYAAILSTEPQLARDLIRAATEAGENLWELPLAAEYRSDIDSAVADIKNTGEGQAGTIIGGLFLREFTRGVPWAHIDFSSTAVAEKAFPGHPKGASGFAVRSTLRYLLRLQESAE